MQKEAQWSFHPPMLPQTGSYKDVNTHRPSIIRIKLALEAFANKSDLGHNSMHNLSTHLIESLTFCTVFVVTVHIQSAMVVRRREEVFFKFISNFA
jgi:hypothetical protein